MLKMFDFKCESCEHTFEKLVKDETTELPCPECNSNSHRMIAAPSAKLIGSGFYHNDYRKREKSYQTKVSRKV